MNYWLSLSTWIPTNWNLSISQIIPEWNMYSGIAVVIFVLISAISFSLSFQCYSETDETPLGFRVLFGLNAALWNIIYIIYYFITVGLIGMKCGD